MNSEPSSPTAWQRTTTYRLLRWATRRRTLTWATLTVVWGITLVALVYGIANWRGRRAWEAERRQLEARGVPVDFTQVIPKPVPDERNAAATPFIRSWFDRTNYSTDFWKDGYENAWSLVKDPRTAVVRRDWTDLNAWAGALTVAATNPGSKPVRPREPLPQFPSRAAAAAAVVRGFQSSDWWRRELQEALKRPETRYPVDYNLQNPWAILLPHLSKVKTACNRLNLRACAQLADGNPQEALVDVTLILGLAQGLQGEPFLISYLVRLACLQISLQPVWEGLAGHVWSDADLVALEEQLGSIETFSGLDRSLASERAGTFLTADLLSSGSYRWANLWAGEGSEITPADRLIPGGWYQREKVGYSRLFSVWTTNGWSAGQRRIFPGTLKTNFEAAASQLEIPYEEPDSDDFTYANPEWSFRDLLHHRLLAKLLLRELPKTPPKTAATQVALDQARIACALERCRLATGELPASLAALSPRFIATVPPDPLTGENYRYRREPEGGYLLYSPGWNLSDEGGAPGARQFDPKAGDWAWAMPAGAAETTSP